MHEMVLLTFVIAASALVSALTNHRRIKRIEERMGRTRPASSRAPVHATTGADSTRVADSRWNAVPPPIPAHVGPPPKRKVTQNAAKKRDLESFLGGRVLLVVGILIALLGVSFFLRYAVTHSLLGPGGRVALASLAGIAALVGGERLIRRGYALFGQGLIGGGFSALYLSSFFASSIYGLFSPIAGFVVAALVTAWAVARALSHDSPFLAHLAFLGGFAAPALFGESTGAILPWAGWLLLLDAGLLAVLLRRRFAGLELLAVIASGIYFGAWLDRWYDLELLASASVTLAVLVAAKLLLTIAPALWHRAAPLRTSLAASAGTGLLLAVGGLSLWIPDHRALFGAAMVALGGLWFGSARALNRRAPDASRGTASLMALSLGAWAAAIPALFQGNGASPAFAIFGAVLVFIGGRNRWRTLRYGGIANILLAATPFLVNGGLRHYEEFRPFLNAEFLSVLAPGVALVVAGRITRRFALDPLWLGRAVAMLGTWLLALLIGAELHLFLRFQPDLLGPLSANDSLLAETLALAIAGVVAVRTWRRAPTSWQVAASLPLLSGVLRCIDLAMNGHLAGTTPVVNAVGLTGLAVVGLLFIAAHGAAIPMRRALLGAAGAGLLFVLTTELHAFGQLQPSARFAAQVGISVLWAVYAAALTALGVVRDWREARWAGLSLFAVTTGKVLLIDMQSLDTAYRMGSFLALGLLLVGASFLYQRRGVPNGAGAELEEERDAPSVP